MYVYFLPLATGDGDSETAGSGKIGPLSTSGGDVDIPVPTHDGGLEHTEARFLPAQEWIQLAESGEIILFPPQFFLLSLINPFLSPPSGKSLNELSTEELTKQRRGLKEFLKTGDPPWGEKCISPIQFMKRKEDGRVVLALDKPGHELTESGRRGEAERVVLVYFRKEGPRKVEVRWKKEVLEEERAAKEKL